MPGNSARILKDAAEHYPVWLSAIGSARRSVLFENYIFADDHIGRELVAAFSAKAREGVHVRVIYDWLGSFAAGRRLWRPLLEAGGEVRAFNPPRPASPLGWLTRDHRKMLSVDGRIGFVTGLCVSRKWLGDPSKGIAPWRDTGVEVRGPGVAGIEQAFAQTWSASGPALAAEELTPPDEMPEAGDVALRVLAAAPNLAGLYHLDQLIAAMARRTLWAHRRLFRRRRALCAGAARRGARWRGRQAAGARRERPAARQVALALRLPAAAGSGRTRFRMERLHAPCEDRGRRRPLGAHRLDQPQSLELARQV